MNFIYKYVIILSIIPFLYILYNIYNKDNTNFIFLQNIFAMYIFLIETIIIKLKLKSRKNPTPNYFISLSFIMLIYTINFLMDGYLSNSLKSITLIIILNSLFYISWSNFKDYNSINGLMLSSIIFATLTNISLTFESNLKLLIIGWLLLSLMNIFLAIKTKNAWPLLISFIAPLSIIFQTGLSGIYLLDFIIFFTLSSILSYIAYKITSDKIFLNGPLIGFYLFIIVNNIVYYNKINLFISIIFTFLSTIIYYSLNNKYKTKVLFIATYVSAMASLLLINLFISNLAITLYIITIILLYKYRNLIKLKYYSLR